MRRFEGKTVVISGAARGQGRSHALGFAAEGANVVGFDLCRQLPTVPVALPTEEDLAQTEALVRATGAEVLTAVADVRDSEQVAAVVAEARNRFGHIDVVLANAGVVGHFAPVWEITDEVFRDVIDIDLIGAWNVLKQGVVPMIEDGRPGSVVVTGSGASLKGLASLAPYVAAKHGLVGLIRTAARELGPHGVRVNLVAPGNTNTPIIINPAVYALYVPDTDEPTDEQFQERAASESPMGQPFVEPEDITRTVMFLSSDEARYVTGAVFPVDGGTSIP